jgi:Fe-S-cluster-containing dehydrogenase component
MIDHDDDLSRRTFVKALGASIALAGLDGCTRISSDKLIPYVIQPPEFTPGVPVHYATSMVLDGFATGLIVEAHEGRPTKIEGNPDHPASLGAAGVLEQASLLQLYDPDRARRPRLGREPTTWDAFVASMSPRALANRAGARGAGLALLLEPTSSPLIAAALASLRSTYPEMHVHFYSPLSSESASQAFDQPGLIAQYDLSEADVILSVASDFLASGPFTLRYARQFADRRRTPLEGMNRLYVMEAQFTVTGATADNRLRCSPSDIEPMLDALLAELRTGAMQSAAWITAVADDLRAHRGRSLVVAGDRLPPRVHALVAAINATLGSVGHTVWYTQSPLLGAGDPTTGIASLVDAIGAGGIDTLICAGGNPAYMTPTAMQFGSLMRRVPNVVHLGLHENETAHEARWFIPAAHYLETWGDARARDGTYSLMQPLVQPLHGGKSVVEVLSALAGTTPGDLGRLRMAAKAAGVAGDDEAWSAALRRGFAAGTESARVQASPRADLLQQPLLRASSPNGMMAVIFAADARVHDGSFSNNGWLQELPDPVTKLTWGNAAHVSVGTAQGLSIETGDVLRLEAGSRAMEIPAVVVPGHTDNVVTLHFGYGRTGAEQVAGAIGTDVYTLWPSSMPYSIDAVTVRAAGAHRTLAITQTHWTMDGRDQAKSATLSDYRASGVKAPPPAKRELTIYDPQQRLASTHQWAMTIDLGTCIGCSACVVACQSENNIPVVGPEEVARSREMHWLRIDRYMTGTNAAPEIVTQPMLCQQCENAPCEYVCPVGATEHSDDGLNEMVYNRCVGTRFCSNNCPYKVRRFNWFDYNAEANETLKLAKNPDVTVRERGVMEKCTFCVQRIREAEISSESAGRALHGDDIRTACQQACPTSAIVFGSLTERDSEMMKRRRETRLYSVLDELGTAPRVQYLARIRNPNPALEDLK